MLTFNHLVINLNVQGRKFNGDPPIGLSTDIGGKKHIDSQICSKIQTQGTLPSS